MGFFLPAAGHTISVRCHWAAYALIFPPLLSAASRLSPRDNNSNTVKECSTESFKKSTPFFGLPKTTRYNHFVLLATRMQMNAGIPLIAGQR
jgi:hypothetical protein